MLGLSNMMIFLLLVGSCAVIIGQAAFFREGFMFGEKKAGQPGVRCGVDLPACGGGNSCLNGFCQRVEISPLLPNQLPVYP